MAAGITAGFDVDMELVKARLANLDRDVRQQSSREWRVAGKEAAGVVRDEWARRAPRGDTGDFRRGAKTGFLAKKGAYVDATTTHKAPDYAAVIEFGGTIPVPHSKGNPRLAGKRRMASRDKPWIGGKYGTSYYLYPARDDKLPEARDVYMAGVQKIIDRHLGGRV